MTFSTLSSTFRTTAIRVLAIAVPVAWGVPGVNHFWRGTVRELWFLNARIERAQDAAKEIAEAVAPDVNHIPKLDDMVQGRDNAYRISSVFGSTPERKALCATTVASCDHKGVDVAAPSGTALCLPGKAGEEVTYTWTPTAQSGGYGNLITVYVPSRKTTYYLAHLKDGSRKVGHPEGKEIKWKAGTDAIAAVGSTGNSTGPHLHLGAKQDGKWRSPTIQETTEAMCGRYDPTFYQESEKK